MSHYSQIYVKDDQPLMGPLNLAGHSYLTDIEQCIRLQKNN